VNKAWNLLLAAAVLALVAVPLVLSGGGEAGKSFNGTDDQAEETIKEIRPDYLPWIEPLWKPPSADIETMLFAVQAAGGAFVLGYVIGYLHRRATAVEKADGCG
jgi:cobalt/nickel transport protein